MFKVTFENQSKFGEIMNVMYSLTLKILHKFTVAFPPIANPMFFYVCNTIEISVTFSIAIFVLHYTKYDI